MNVCSRLFSNWLLEVVLSSETKEKVSSQFVKLRLRAALIGRQEPLINLSRLQQTSLSMIWFLRDMLIPCGVHVWLVLMLHGRSTGRALYLHLCKVDFDRAVVQSHPPNLVQLRYPWSSRVSMDWESSKPFKDLNRPETSSKVEFWLQGGDSRLNTWSELGIQHFLGSASQTYFKTEL